MKIHYYLLIVIFSGIVGCSKDNNEVNSEENELPSIQNQATNPAEATVTPTTIEIEGSVEDNGKSLISYGVVWGNDPTPTLNDNIVQAAAITNQFSQQRRSNEIISFTMLIEGLDPGKSYYFRVYAENENGVAYGEEINIETESMAGTKWDFHFNHFPNGDGYNWDADVEFYDDGTAFYDEPATPGVYATYGTWELDGKVLTYYLQGDPEAESYIMTGTIEGNAMQGTYTWGADGREFTAVKY